MKLDGKVAIVTGGAQGIGAAYCTRLAAEGAAVGVVDLTRMDQAKEVERQIVDNGGRALAIQADVTKEDQMEAMAKEVTNAFGRIDAIINNAALYQDMIGASNDQVLEVNFFGVINSSNAVIPQMYEQRSGSIINIASTAAYPLPMGGLLMAPPTQGPPKITPGGYGLAKNMLLFLTKNMAKTLGPYNIRVNAIAPGLTMSEATKKVVPPVLIERLTEEAALHRALEPEDLAGAALFLVSDDSALITGQVLVVDAGVIMAG